MQVVTEPGQRIVRHPDGIKPWDDLPGFLQQAIGLSLADLDLCPPGLTVFDRGLGDAVAALERLSGRPHPLRDRVRAAFHRLVFIAPPWPEIHQQTAERRHGWAEAVAEFQALGAFYPALGFTVATLPKLPVDQRADFVLSELRA